MTAKTNAPAGDTARGAEGERLGGRLDNHCTTEAIAEYIDRGFALVAIPAGGKWPTETAWNERANAITSRDDLSRINGAGVGLAHAYSGTCAIDVDEFHGAATWLTEHGIDLSALLMADDAVQIHSGRPSRAKLLYRLPESVEWLPTLERGEPVDGRYPLELRCATQGGKTVQDVLPPSIHPDTGNPYEWRGDWRNLPVLPEALLDAWIAEATPAVQAHKPIANADQSVVQSILAHIPNADVPYSDWIRIGMAIHHATGGDGYDLWHDWSAQSDKHDEIKMRRKWASFGERDDCVTLATLIYMAKQNGYSDARTFDEILADARAMDTDTDPGDVESLVAEAAALSPARERKVWEAIKAATKFPFSTLKAAKQTEGVEDEPDHLALARSVIRAISPENIIGTQAHLWTYGGGIWKPLEPRGEKHIVQSHLDAEHDGESITKTLIEGVTDVFRTEVYRPTHEWNIGPEDAICTPTGELVLVDGSWQSQLHVREHYRTTRIPVDYDAMAECPRFLQFLDEVFAGDPDAQEKADAILEMIGYTMMAHNRFERFAILVGTGANGKSVLLSVIEALLGPENVAGVQPCHFDRSFQRAHLHLKLANIVTEIREGEIIADAELKSITSGEATTVEHKFRDPFVLKPYATCWFGTNHMPHTRDFSDALFRRAIVVPFNNVFEAGRNRDPNLKHKLYEELPGILNMALAAYAGVVRRGDFTEPQSCIEAKHEWRLNADQAAQFVEDCCTRGCGETGSRALYAAYTSWAEGVGIRHTLTQRNFSERIERLGFQRYRTSGERGFRGIKLEPTAAEYRVRSAGE